VHQPQHRSERSKGRTVGSKGFLAHFISQNTGFCQARLSEDQGVPVFPECRTTASSCPTYVAERDRLPTNLEGLAPHYLLKVLHRKGLSPENWKALSEDPAPSSLLGKRGMRSAGECKAGWSENGLPRLFDEAGVTPGKDIPRMIRSTPERPRPAVPSPARPRDLLYVEELISKFSRR
jgi:hypothetical protein